MKRIFLAAAAVLALPAAPALAQVPEIGLRFFNGLHNDTMEDGNCVLGNSDGISISVGQADPNTRFASAVSARVIAIVRSGHNRFEDRHGGKFLNKADGTGLIHEKNARIAGSGTVSWSAGSSFYMQPQNSQGRAICWGDDNLDTGDTEVELVIANGPGYTVDPGASRHTFTIRDNDDCANPAATPGGVVYKINGGSSCICATESQHSSVRRALDRTIPTPGDDGRYGTDDDGTTDAPAPRPGFFKQLAAQFHDPSYLYCAESPYKGLPG